MSSGSPSTKVEILFEPFGVVSTEMKPVLDNETSMTPSTDEESGVSVEVDERNENTICSEFTSDGMRDRQFDIMNKRWENDRLGEEVELLRAQVSELTNELHQADALAQQAEVFKLELINHCNKLEGKIAHCAQDKRMIQLLKAENAEFAKKQRGINRDLVKHISGITRSMISMESGYKKQLTQRDNAIQQLQEQLRRYETGAFAPTFGIQPALSSSASSSPERVDRRKNFAMGKTISARALGSVVGSIFEKNSEYDDLSSTATLGPGQIRDLKLKAARVDELEKQLEEKQNALGVFQLASSLVTQLDVPDNSDLKDDYFDSKNQQEEENFLRELEDLSHLEKEMGSELEKLQARLDSQRSLFSNGSLGSSQGDLMKVSLSRRSSMCSNTND